MHPAFLLTFGKRVFFSLTWVAVHCFGSYAFPLFPLFRRGNPCSELHLLKHYKCMAPTWFRWIPNPKSETKAKRLMCEQLTFSSATCDCTIYTYMSKQKGNGIVKPVESGFCPLPFSFSLSPDKFWKVEGSWKVLPALKYATCSGRRWSCPWGNHVGLPGQWVLIYFSCLNHSARLNWFLVGLKLELWSYLETNL